MAYYYISHASKSNMDGYLHGGHVLEPEVMNQKHKFPLGGTIHMCSIVHHSDSIVLITENEAEHLFLNRVAEHGTVQCPWLYVAKC